MALKFVQNINLNGLELQNVVLQPLTTAPTTLNSVGRMYFNTTDKKPFWYNGSEFITFPLQSDITTLQDYFTDGRANDALKLGGVALDGLFTALSTSTTNAVSITVGGISKNITAADLKTSLGLGGLAYKDSLAVSDIPAIPWDKITANTRPTTLAGYGITDALPLSGGVMNTNAYISWNKGENDSDVDDWDTVTGYGLRIISSDTETSKAPTQFSTGLYVKGRYGFILSSQGGAVDNFHIKNIGRDWKTIIHSGNIGTQRVLSAERIVTGDETDETKVLYVDSNKNALFGVPVKFSNQPISTTKKGSYVSISGLSEGAPFNYASAFTIFDGSISDLQLAWYRSLSAPSLAMRISENETWSSWKTIAFLDSTVAAAKKLVTEDGSDAVTVDSNGNTVLAGNLKIGEATLYYENGVLMVDKPFASTGAISTKGVGSSSGGGGSVDLTNIVSNILPASGSITGSVSSYNIGATDKRWGTVYANVGNFNNLSASGFSAQTINANSISVSGVKVATLTDINEAKTYALQVANEAANSVYNTLLGGEVDESLDTIKEILDYVKDLDSENIVVKKTSTITGDGAKKTFNFQHNLNTKDVIVFVYEVSNPYQQVFVDVKMTSTSTITVEFAEAPANGTSYKVVVMA